MLKRTIKNLIFLWNKVFCQFLFVIMAVQIKYSAFVKAQEIFYDNHCHRKLFNLEDSELQFFFASFDGLVLEHCQTRLFSKSEYKKRLTERLVVKRYLKLSKIWKLLTSREKNEFLMELGNREISVIVTQTIRSNSNW